MCVIQNKERGLPPKNRFYEILKDNNHRPYGLRGSTPLVGCESLGPFGEVPQCSTGPSDPVYIRWTPTL